MTFEFAAQRDFGDGGDPLRPSPAKEIPFPVSLLIFAASLLGKKAVIQRLCGFLQVDISKTRKLLEWEPPISVDEGLRRAVKVFKM